MKVNYEHYRIFYFVAKYHSLSKAADALYSNQPNVSRAMKQLEHDLGCQLFTRSSKGIELTAEGEGLYSHVAIAFEQLRLGEEELFKSLHLQSGTISIGASETAIHLYLLDQLSLFHQKYPDIQLKIYNYSISKAVKAVQNGQIDMAVVTTPTNCKAPLAEIPLIEFEDTLVVGCKHQRLSMKKCSLKDLSAETLICLAQETNTFQHYSQFYLDHNLILAPDIEVATSDLILPMVKKNLGIGFLPKSFIKSALEEGSVFEIPLKETLPKRNVCVVYHTQHTLNTAAKKLFEILQETLPH